MRASDCPERDAVALEEMHADVKMLQGMSTRGRDAFDKYLSFGSRAKDDTDGLPLKMASAILEEATLASGH